MDTPQPVQYDERTIAVTNTAHRWAYHILIFALFLDVIWRGWAYHENAWDLLGLAILSGVVAAWYQACHKALGRKILLLAGLSFLIACVVGGLVTLMLLWLR